MPDPRGWLIGLLLLAPAAVAAGPGLGQPLPPAAQMPRIWPDGRGLPPGAGGVERGEQLYAEQCRGCHGARGRGASAAELAGGIGSLTGEYPDRTIGSFWPYAPPLFDYLRRAMPYDRPGSLEPDQVYALLAYLLYLNGLVARDARIDAATLSALRMPNRDGFIRLYPTR